MSAFLTAIGTAITSVLGYMGSVTTALLGNEAFQLVAAVVFTLLFIGTIVGLVKGIRGKKKGRK